MTAPSIAVFSDVICPWCYIGKRRLERALAELGLGRDIAWLPYELNPDMPEAGMPRSEYRARKFGAARSAELDRQIAELAAAEGIAIAFDRMERTPNTRRAHMMIAQAGAAGRGDAMAEALFRAYFEDALDIGDETILLGLAESAGLDPEAARAGLSDEALRARVVATEGEATRLGVTGVPFFIVERQWAVSGARPTPAWVEALRDIMGRGGPEAATHVQ